MLELKESEEYEGGEVAKVKEFDPMAGINLPAPEISDNPLRLGLTESPIGEMPKDEMAESKKEFEEIGEKERLHALVDGVNPQYDPDVYNEFSTNCGLCALATWMRANEIYPDSCASGSNIGTVSMMEYITGLRFKEANLHDISRAASIVGPNRNCLCAMVWPSGMSGHWVNLATSKSGELYVLDGQCGEVAKFEDYVRENPARHYCVSDWKGR